LAKNSPELFFERGESFDQFGGIELAIDRAGARDTVNWVIRKMSLKGSLIQHRDAPLPIADKIKRTELIARSPLRES
jgi:hypothetical protein